MQRTIFNFLLALEGVFSNQLRALLTALGIIFGVAAVIAMLAIGTGAKQSILEQMALIGTNNIVIKSIVLDKEENSSTDRNDKQSWSPGLTVKDIEAIEKTIPSIKEISPETISNTIVIQSGKQQKAKCIGITNSFFSLNNLKIKQGNYFHKVHMDGGKPVCIIGKNIQNKFFPKEDPIGKKIKCGTTWLKIIGVLEKRFATKESLENLGIRDYNADVYIPLTTSLLRFKNRAHISKDDLKRNNSDEGDQNSPENYHQLDRVVVHVKDSKYLISTRDLIASILKRRHGNLIDFEVDAPEEKLEAQQKSQETWNQVLAFIAGISLLVGGIGIMNIMLATVMERIKEIGVRRSLGANQNDIILQFLFEAIFISLIGGIIGVILGVSSAFIIKNNYDIPTVVSNWSVFLSFGVAITVGLVFGIIPAQKAAKQDPIKALRSD